MTQADDDLWFSPLQKARVVPLEPQPLWEGRSPDHHTWSRCWTRPVEERLPHGPCGKGRAGGQTWREEGPRVRPEPCTDGRYSNARKQWACHRLDPLEGSLHVLTKRIGSAGWSILRKGEPAKTLRKPSNTTLASIARCQPRICQLLA